MSCFRSLWLSGMPTEGRKVKARKPTDGIIPKTMRCRNNRSMAFQLPCAGIEEYKCSFFPQTIRDWNDLPDNPFSTTEMSDVRFAHAFLGLISPPSEPPGEIMSFYLSSYTESINF